MQRRVHGAGVAAGAWRDFAAVDLSAGEYPGAADFSFAAAVISVDDVTVCGVHDSGDLWTYGRIAADTATVHAADARGAEQHTKLRDNLETIRAGAAVA
jgi:hypothetical protein